MKTPYRWRSRDARRAKAAALRLEGKSYREIAAELGVEVSTAWEDVRAVRKEQRKPLVKKMEAEREKNL